MWSYKNLNQDQGLQTPNAYRIKTMVFRPPFGSMNTQRNQLDLPINQLGKINEATPNNLRDGNANQ